MVLIVEEIIVCKFTTLMMVRAVRKRITTPFEVIIIQNGVVRSVYEESES
jgi:hypothetical protein